MRRLVLGFALMLGMSLLAPRSGWAQVGSFGALASDPFATYYGWYLPNQAYQASQPRVQDTINAITVMRQRSAIAERDGLFDSRSRFDLDDEGEFGGRYSGRGGGAARGGRPPVGGQQSGNVFGQNVRGTGPPLYFSRTDRYFPSLRAGNGPNRNISAMRYARGTGGMGGGMGGNVGGGMPIPGPR